MKPNENSDLARTWELRPFAGILMNSLDRTASRKHNVLVNDIPGNICIDADRQLLATVLSSLLSSVIGKARNSWIQLTAKVYSDVILLHIKDHNATPHYVVDKHLRAMAGKMGGVVEVCSRRNNVTTIAFSFPNLPIKE